jgi:alanyl-tRNA synthetase
MVQFKQIFLGQEKSPFSRAVSCQKCMRAGGKHSDLENVGHTARHHTFFEMLGNFSFGDYFKRDAILFSWELFIDLFRLPGERLYVSVFEEDDEAATLWTDLTGISEDRIVRLGAKDNFWQMADTGPCGPCSEIIFDQGGNVGCGTSSCAVGCECDRFLELWNLVFMQFDRDEKGTLTPLPKPSIDTGMGLERISAVLQGKTNNFDTDLFTPIINAISSLARKEYGFSLDTDTSLRVIADHLRAIVFMISEGLVPSNEGRGYVLRRIIRRASRHAKLLSIEDPCLHKLTEPVLNNMGDGYPEIIRERERINKLLLIEEERFNKTIDAGLNILDNLIGDLKTSNSHIIPGEEIFRLYDTYGFPLDFAKDIALDAGLTIDEEAFQREMESQRERSKVIAKPPSAARTDIGDSIELEKSTFIGYETLENKSSVAELIKHGKKVESLREGEEGNIILDTTPFYGESGGQVGDTGTMKSDQAHIDVLDTKKLNNTIIVHHVKVKRGEISKGDLVICHVNDSARHAIMRNHTATHLIHTALRIVLGDHVKQSGSVVDSRRLRFDFTHYNAMTDDEIQKTEDIMNAKVLENLPVKTEIMGIDEAVKRGAVALFDEKYGETVRVVSVGDFSKELCGGTHCESTGQIGLCIIISESSVASGIRRVEAVTGKNALDYIREQMAELDGIKSALKTDTPRAKIEKILEDTKTLEKEIQALKTRSSKNAIPDALESAFELDGIKIVSFRQDGLNPNELRLLADNVRDRIKSGVVVVTSVFNSQASIVCMVTKDLRDTYHAGHIVQSISNIAGGKGGGRPQMAQGGTKDVNKLDNALGALPDILKKIVSRHN